MRICLLLSSILALALAPAALGQREKLKIGDAAPALDVEGWIGRDPGALRPDGVYAIIFWEEGKRGQTPTRSVARGERFAELFASKGLVVIYVAQESLEDLMKAQRDPLPERGLVIAADNHGRTERAWVRAADKEPPLGFIVGKGRIMHMGTPGDPDFETILVQVLTGRYDPQLQKQAEPKLVSARRARKFRDWRMAMKTYDEVVALDAGVFAVIALERFKMMLVDMDDQTAAYEYARTVLIGQLFARDPGALRMLAVMIATSPDLTGNQRDLDVAMTAANLAMELAGQRDPEALSTAAMVHFHRGEFTQAVELQSQAYFIARPDEKAEYRRALDAYRGAVHRSGARSGP